MYKLNGDNDEMKPIKEAFRKYIEKKRENAVSGYPEHIKKKMMENFEKEDREFIESLSNKNSFQEVDVKSLIKKDFESRGIKFESDDEEEDDSVSETIEEKMKKILMIVKKKKEQNLNK